MDVEQLQAALASWDEFGWGPGFEQGECELIVEAVRLVADPNIEAATQAVGKHLHDMFPDIPMAETSALIAKDAVAAALTRGEDPKP